jgi:hypothetical protein
LNPRNGKDDQSHDQCSQSKREEPSPRSQSRQRLHAKPPDHWDQYQQKKKPGVLKGNFNSSHFVMFPQSSKFRTNHKVHHPGHYGRFYNVFARRQTVIFLESEQMRMNSGTSASQTLAGWVAFDEKYR